MTGARHLPFHLVGVVALASSIVAVPRAEAELAGRYKVTGNRVQVKVKSWGEDCGPRPQSSSRRGGKAVEVRPAGAHVVVGGQRSDRCWSQNPKVQRRRASASPGRWQVVCETPSDDPRFEHGEYTLEQVGEDTLRLTELSTYNWRIEGDHCEALIRLVRTWERVPEEVEERPEEPQTPTARCSGSPGEPVSLEVRPRSARIAPGARLCFRASGRDGEGCRAPVPVVAWSRSDDGPEGSFTPEGCFVAGDGQGRLEVTARAGSLSATARIDVRPPDISDLLAARLGEAGEDLAPLDDAASPEAHAGAVHGVGDASAASSEGSRGLWAVGAVGVALVALLGIVAAIVIRRGRRRAEAFVDDTRPSSAIVASARPPLSATESRVCPTCRREFPGDTFFCPHDATELVPSNEAEAQPVGAQENKICPKCRRGYPPSAKHCPNDAVELVPYSSWRVMRLQDRSAGEPSGGMICPKCAEKYEQDVLYCRKDGNKLVPLN